MATRKGKDETTAAEDVVREHEDTWGASEGFKAKFQDERGDKIRADVEEANEKAEEDNRG